MPLLDGKIRCPACSEWKALDFFIKSDIKRKSGYCRKCRNKKKSDWRNRNRQASNARKMASYRRNREAILARRGDKQKKPIEKNKLWKYNLKRYGITPERYTVMLSLQDGRCACCN